jgi:WhiB family redox-sensing transcriptional regulator
VTHGVVRPSLIDGMVPGWVDQALCATIDPDLWFGEYGGNNYEAKKLCQGCPVRAQCLEYGKDEKWGVWGGLGPSARRALGWGRGRPGIDYDIPEFDR